MMDKTQLHQLIIGIVFHRGSIASFHRGPSRIHCEIICYHALEIHGFGPAPQQSPKRTLGTRNGPLPAGGPKWQSRSIFSIAASIVDAKVHFREIWGCLSSA